jgi:AbrB family looped-hinge helix DNA binding protein
MRTTIDKAGRVVVPAAIRERAGLTPGTELEITRRMVARPTAAADARPEIDIAAIIDDERNRWP